MSTGSCITTSKLPDLIENQDLISNLPDVIISKILSCLHTKEAVRTCVLCKSWEYKWTTCLENINIEDDDDEDDDGDDDEDDEDSDEDGGKLVDDPRSMSFLSYVHRVLDLSGNLGIRSFSLVCNRKYNCYHLNKWIGTVLRRKVENLDIDNQESDDSIIFPQCSHNLGYDSLVYLRIWSSGTLKLPHESCFSQLKSLTIGCEAIEVQEVRSSSQSLLLDFPVLKVLNCWGCKWLNVKSVEIRAPVLVIYKMGSSDFLHVNDYEMKICAPILEKFQSSGSCLMDKFAISPPSIPYVSLKHYSGDGYLGLRAHTLLKEVPLIKRLKLSGEIIEALFIQEKLGLVFPSFDWLKQLDVRSNYCIKDLFQLLEKVPSIESLSLDLIHWRKDDYGQLEHFPSCLVSHINEVRLKNVKGGCDEVQLAEFILRNASKLEKLLVSAHTRPLMPVIEIELMLSRLPKSSSVSIVVERKRPTHLAKINSQNSNR